MVVCHSVADAAQALTMRDPARASTSHAGDTEPSVVFLFPGQGAQQVNMGRELFETEPVFREQVGRCCEMLRPHLELDLRTVIYPAQDRLEEAKGQVTQTFIAQPALFVVEYALAKLWMSWGIRPQAMLGHGIGECVAACLAGVFSLSDALGLVAARGRLVQKQPPGAMLSIPLPEQELKTLLGRKLSLAAVNAPARCVASGPLEAVEVLEKKLEQRGVACLRLRTSHAFHSEMMDPVLHWFNAKLKKVRFHPPQIPYLANLTGKWVAAQEATDPNWWTAHLRQTVRFADGLAELGAGLHGILLEVGPGQTLTTLAQQHPALGPGHLIVPSLDHPEERPGEVAAMLDALGRLWLAGVTVNWAGFHSHEKRHRLPLPTYPFERKRYWVEPGGFDPGQNPVPIGTPLRPTETTGAPQSQAGPFKPHQETRRQSGSPTGRRAGIVRTPSASLIFGLRQQKAAISGSDLRI